MLLLFSQHFVSSALKPNGLQHTRPPCHSLSPRVCSNSCPFSWWCSLTILILCLPLLLPSVFPSIRVFSSELVLQIRWPKCWNFSFSISPFSRYAGLISFRIDWFDLLASKKLSRVFSSTTQLFGIYQNKSVLGSDSFSQSPGNWHTSFTYVAKC